MVNITPESEIFSIFKSLDYKAWYALAEFVDNSVQSYEDWGKDRHSSARPKQLEVKIDIFEEGDKRKITISDNARGIELKDFERAFRVASRPPGHAKGLNEFGMGMKTAGFWFANRWQVRTSVYGETLARMMLFDLGDILNNKVTEIEPIEFPESRDASFTIIELEQLNQFPKGQTLGKVKRYLASIYRRHLSSGQLDIKVNGESLRFEAPGILKVANVREPDSEPIIWKRQVSLEFGGDKKISGWVGLKDKATVTNSGFALFRRGRLVQGGPDDPYSPREICSTSNKIQYMRLFGELDVQGFGVTHTKDSIDWAGLEEEFIEKLKIELKGGDFDFIHQATHYKVAKPRNEISEGDLTPSDLTSQISVPIERAPQLFEEISQINRRHADVELPEILERTAPSEAERVFEHTLENGSTWKAHVRIVNSQGTELIRVSSDLEPSGDVPNGAVEIEINTGHPFFITYADPDWQNLEPLLQFLGVLSIGVGYSRYEGGRYQALVDSINRIALRWHSGSDTL